MYLEIAYLFCAPCSKLFAKQLRFYEKDVIAIDVGFSVCLTTQFYHERSLINSNIT